MSRTRRLLSGVALHYAGQVLITVLGLWVTPFLLYHIGPHDYGLWLVGYQLLTYLMLADLGIVAVLPRALATATGRASGPEDEAAEVAGLLGQTCRLTLWQMPLAAGAALVLWASLPAEWQALRLPLGAAMAAYVLLFPLRLFQAALQGLQDLAFLSAVQTAVWFVNTAVSVGLVWAGEGLEALAWSWIAAQGTLNVLCGLRLWRCYRRYLPSRLGALDWRRARAYIAQGFWASLTQAAVALLNSTDVVFIGLLLGPAAVVPYACTSKLVLILGNHAQAPVQLALPALTEVRASQSPERVATVCAALTLGVLLASGLVACLVVGLNEGFVNWWIGADQFGGGLLTGLLALVMLVRHWNLTLVVSMFSLGYNRRIPLTAILDGLVTVASLGLLIPSLGLLGAPVSFLVGTCTVSLPANVWALARVLGVSPLAVLGPLRGWLVRMGPAVLALVFLTRIWVPEHLGSLAGTAGAITLLYLVLMLPLFLRPPLGPFLEPFSKAVRCRLVAKRDPGKVNP